MKPFGGSAIGSVVKLLILVLLAFISGFLLGFSRKKRKAATPASQGTLEKENIEVYSLLERLDEGVLLCRPDGKILYANPKARAYLALTKKPLPNLFEIMRDQNLESAIRQKKEGSFEKEFFWPTNRLLSVHVFPIEKDLVGIALQDLTPFKRFFDIKRDFITHLAHEFRTPLTAIEGYAENLLEEVPENLKADLEIVLKNARRLAKLLKDLQVLSRLELQGIPEEDFEPLELKEVLYAAVETLFPEASKKGVTFHFISVPERALLEGSFDDLLRAFINIFENAVKFSPRGGAVSISLKETTDSWMVEIADQGPGIPESEKERVFERFYKGRGEGPKGTGLGLAIVKHVIKAHGGEIEIRSFPGKGTKFLIRLPKEKGAA